MSDKINEPAEAPKFWDRRIVPPGVIPRNLQTRIVAGIAVVILLVVAFSNRNSPSDSAKPKVPLAVVSNPDSGRIQDYRNRIEEQTRKLQAEQSQLSSAQLLPGKTANDSASGGSVLPGRDKKFPAVPGTIPDTEPDIKWIRADQQRREYQSLFASNVALTYRDDAGSRSGLPDTQPPVGSARATAPTSAIVAAQGEAVLQNTVSSMPRRMVASPATELRSDFRNSMAGSAEPAEWQTKTFRIPEGTILETVLTNRLNGEFSGPVNCMVSVPIYSLDGNYLLIPQGSRVLGEVRKVESLGQQRLRVVFHRLLMPDGSSVNLDQFQGLSPAGDTGLRDQVNHHYLQVFGVSLAIGAIAGLGQVDIRGDPGRAGVNAYEQGVSGSLSQSSLRILDRYLNVMPTFTIREGFRIKIYFTGDLELRAQDSSSIVREVLR